MVKIIYVEYIRLFQELVAGEFKRLGLDFSREYMHELGFVLYNFKNQSPMNFPAPAVYFYGLPQVNAPL